ncbi:MAG: hypothetical protein U0350_27835 [Caldilineaceae bacterium]
MNNERLQKPQFAYRSEFGLDELVAAQACVEAHEFAMVKQLLPPVTVEVVDPNHDLGLGQSRTNPFFIEHSPALWKLFDYDPFLYVRQVLCQVKEWTINRTAAINHNPKAVWLLWYANWQGFSHSERSHTFVRWDWSALDLT